MLIVTGVLECWVVKHHEKLFFAIGVKKVLGHEKVSYFLNRKKDFSILASQLAGYPYKERCAWTQYWVDTE